MRMTLKDWDAHGNPGVFTGPGFECWREPSVLDPSEETFHLVITSGKSEHPFKDKYADVTHQFGSFYGLRQYLGKSPADIEGEVDPSAEPPRPPVTPWMESLQSGMVAILEQHTNDVRDQTRRESLFLVENHHDASCGAPPHIDDTDRNQCLYYFESTSEGQLIFVFDRSLQVGRLYCGKAAWGRVLLVIDGEVKDIHLSSVAQSWLKVCWEAATAA